MSKILLHAKKLAFIKRHSLTRDKYLSLEMIQKARKEIGYSKSTTGTDIRIAIRGCFIEELK